jgi:hypothetical protein
MKNTSLLVLALAAIPLFAQGPPPGAAPAKPAAAKAKPPAGPFTRLPDGHPDMQGFWNAVNNGGAVFDVQNHPIARTGVGAGRGAVVEPADGYIPYTREASAKAKDNFEHHMNDEPELHCFESGVPHQNFVQFGFQIIQTPGYFGMFWEFMHAYRIIPTDGRPHISPEIKLFQGDPVGRWEGDTLVVDVTNSNDKTWNDTSGNFKTSHAHIVERYTPVDANTINYEAVITDPTVYTAPWKIAYQFARANLNNPNYEQMEFGCVEGNQDLTHYIEAQGGKAKQVR